MAGEVMAADMERSCRERMLAGRPLRGPSRGVRPPAPRGGEEENINAASNHRNGFFAFLKFPHVLEL